MLPLTDFVRPRRFPWITAALAAASTLVFVYQLAHGLDTAVDTLGFRPCEVAGSCHDVGLAWPLDVITAMFAHGGWSHLIGNLVFLLVFGPRVEELLGAVRYLGLYLVAGLAATALYGELTLAFTTAHTQRIPAIGASGAISGVLAAYALAFPFERILAWLIPSFFLRIPALAFVGVWFVLQALQGIYVLDHPGGEVAVAFTAHVGGVLAGALILMFTRIGGDAPAAPLGKRLIPRLR